GTTPQGAVSERLTGAKKPLWIRGKRAAALYGQHGAKSRVSLFHVGLRAARGPQTADDVRLQVKRRAIRHAESTMAGSVNKVILVGNLGADPEVRRTQDGRPIVNLRV